MSKVKTLQDFVKEAKSQIKEVQIFEVDDLIARGYQVLDVREPHEFSEGTLSGALNIPRGVLEGAADFTVKASEDLQDRDKKWLLLCKSSARSAMATVVLQQMGFTDVMNINGGFNAWKEAGLKVVVPETKTD